MFWTAVTLLNQWLLIKLSPPCVIIVNCQWQENAGLWWDVSRIQGDLSQFLWVVTILGSKKTWNGGIWWEDRYCHTTHIRAFWDWNQMENWVAYILFSSHSWPSRVDGSSVERNDQNDVWGTALKYSRLQYLDCQHIWLTLQSRNRSHPQAINRNFSLIKTSCHKIDIRALVEDTPPLQLPIS